LIRNVRRKGHKVDAGGAPAPALSPSWTVTGTPSTGWKPDPGSNSTPVAS
jgi:hypothetical protein